VSSAANGSGPAAGADSAGAAGGSASSAAGESASLAVQGLVAGYGEVVALDGVTVTAGSGGITAVLGANGAGKTTLLRAVSGMIKTRRGRILLADHDVAGRSPEQIVRAGIAHVPEGQGVIPELTVEENLRIGMMSSSRGPCSHGPGCCCSTSLRSASRPGSWPR
jgi:branched-chain amino acid transport system ATP-binding protein